MDLIQEFTKSQIGNKKLPQLKPGDTVRVHQKIKEGEKERVQVFEGVILRTRGGQGLDGTFTVRKVSFGVGVEKIFPYHMPSIVKIEVTKRGKARRARLYYLRERQAKAARLEEEKLTEEELKALKYEKEEAPKAEKKEEGKEEVKKEETPQKQEKAEEPKKEEKAKKEPSKEQKPKEEPKEKAEKAAEKKPEVKKEEKK